MNGLPIRLGWSPRLLEMEAALSKALPDQAEVASRVAKGIRNRIALFEGEGTPLGYFLVVGPLGEVQKLANGLALFMFPLGGAVLQVEMSDYSEKLQVSRLFGHSGGLSCGYLEGELTEPVWRNPLTVILLNEVEKAHPDVWPVLSAIRGEGKWIDGDGRSVSFENAILLLHTTIGYSGSSPRPDQVVSAGQGYLPDSVRQVLESKFHPEILRQVGDILFFRQDQ